MSRSSLLILVVVRPGGCLVIERTGVEADVQDADKPVGDLPQGVVVVEGTLLVVVGAGAGRGLQRGLGLRHERVDEPVVVHEADVAAILRRAN